MSTVCTWTKLCVKPTVQGIIQPSAGHESVYEWIIDVSVIRCQQVSDTWPLFKSYLHSIYKVPLWPDSVIKERLCTYILLHCLTWYYSFFITLVARFLDQALRFDWYVV